MSIKITGGRKLRSYLNKNSKIKSNILNVGFLSPDMAQIAMKNEYGGYHDVSSEYADRALAKGIKLGESIKIIPRPFMQQTVNVFKNEWGKQLSNIMHDTPNVIESLDGLGQIIKTQIQYTIQDGDFEENPSFVQEIKDNDTPLIDSGKMLDSVDYEIL